MRMEALTTAHYLVFRNVMYCIHSVCRLLQLQLTMADWNAECWHIKDLQQQVDHDNRQHTAKLMELTVTIFVLQLYVAYMGTDLQSSRRL